MPGLNESLYSDSLERRSGTEPEDSSSSDSSSSNDDDIVLINGVPVKLRGDGSIDDSQPSGLVMTASGLKLRGDGTIDDSQPGVLRIVGTRRGDRLFGTGIVKESLRGRRGKDDFVLGDNRGSFYLKGGKRSKDRTFAIIEDFGRGDDVVLHGSRSQYSFAMASKGGTSGLGIYRKGSNGKDLVALLAGEDRLSRSSVDFIG